MPEEFGEHLIRDQKPFLHPESLQILQIHSFMMVLLLFSSPHSFSTVQVRGLGRSWQKLHFVLSDTCWCSFWNIILLEDPTLAIIRFKKKNIYIYIYLSHTQLHREYITSSEMYSLHLTHPKWTHTGAVGSHVTAPGEQLGVRCLAQGHLSRGIEGGYSPPTNNPCRTWDSNPQPSANKSDLLSIRPRLPHF